MFIFNVTFHAVFSDIGFDLQYEASSIILLVFSAVFSVFQVMNGEIYKKSLISKQQL